MKLRNKKLFPLILTAVLAASLLLLTACGTVSSQSAGMGAANLTNAVTGSFSESASGSAAGTGSSVSCSAGSEAAEELVSDAFSKSDLSGEYDADEAVVILLTGESAEADSELVSIDGSTVTIKGAGTFIISGTLTDGNVTVDASKDDKVRLVLDGASISSQSFAAIYVKQADKVFITLAEGEENTLANGGSFVGIDENNVDAVVFSKDDLTINGSGSLTVTTPAGHGISCKDDLVITGGSIEITAKGHGVEANDSLAVSGGSLTVTAGKDGIHVENDDDDSLGNVYIADGSFTITSADDAIHANTLIEIDGGSFEIRAAEGIEATYIRINGGEITITATDDGINAARKSSAYTPTVEINGGSITIAMGQGDTDAVDSNGNIVMNGGVVTVTGSSSFDYDGTAEYNGGTIIVNGQQLDYIPNQMMGGGTGGMNGMNGRGGRR